MRIAVSGSHCTGKSSLIRRLADSLPGYVTVDEPYHLLEAEGYEFCHPPTLEDFEAQLQRSMSSLRAGGAEVLFDRCPADFLGYALAHGAHDFAPGEWLGQVSEALQRLDLIVFVPVESPDRIDVTAADDFDNSRERVDEYLREILLENVFDFGATVIEVAGSLQARAQTVIQCIDNRGTT